MTIQFFIDQYKDEIDQAIRSEVPNAVIDDNERELWIENDESLYRWALEEGVEFGTL